MNPRYIFSYGEVVSIYRMQGKYDEAIKFLSKAEKVNPEVTGFIKMLENRMDNYKVIEEWVESDLEEIIGICKTNKIKMILQNYPMEPQLAVILRGVAEKYSIPFVDNHQIFRELLDRGEKREDLLAADDDHCSAKGYGIMAKNIYRTIVEEEIFD